MNIAQFLGQTAAVLALIGNVPYVISILKHRTKPERASWLIWALVNYSLVFSYHSSGATTTLWLNIAYCATTTTIFLLSLKYGVGGFTHLDVTCLIGAAAGLLLWWLTSNPVTAMYLNVIVDAIGFLPTIKKAYLRPDTESKLAWNISVIANLCNVLALTTWQFKIALFPVYNLVFNVLVAVLLYGKTQEEIARSNH